MKHLIFIKDQKMIRCVKTLVLLIAIFFIGSPLNAKESKSPEYIKYVDEIVSSFVKDMEKKYKLHCYGSGGSMPNDVEKINVLFISRQKSTVDDARKMEVTAIQELLQRINNHEKIKPYLREYPFDTNRVGVSISFRTKTDEYPLDGSIASVFIAKNKIFYYTAEMRMSDPITTILMDKNNKPIMDENNRHIETLKPGEPEEELVPLMEEPYEEALKIVKTTSRPNQE
jgi:hypothetical protein